MPLLAAADVLAVADGSSPFHLVGDPPAPLGPLTLLSDATFHPVVLGLLLIAGVAYGRAARQARAKGQVWDRWRGASFVVALAVLAVATLSGLDAFERTSFVVVSVQHSLVALVAPAFLALSSPITLAIRASGPTLGARIQAAATGRVARVVTYPLVSALLFMGSFFVIYFTPLFRTSLDHPALWDLDLLALLVSGSLFVWPLVALDPLPKVLGHGYRMLWLVLTLPFFTILGMALESQTRPIAPGLSLAEIRGGGGVIWVIGEVLGVVGMLAVLVQWCRLEETEAKRRDRVLDPEAASQLAHWKANRRSAAGLLADPSRRDHGRLADPGDSPLAATSAARPALGPGATTAGG